MTLVIGSSPDDKCFFVDTNNCPWAPAFLEKYEIAEPTGKFGASGYCIYPEYRLVKEV